VPLTVSRISTFTVPRSAAVDLHRWCAPDLGSSVPHFRTRRVGVGGPEPGWTPPHYSMESCCPGVQTPFPGSLFAPAKHDGCQCKRLAVATRSRTAATLPRLTLPASRHSLPRGSPKPDSSTGRQSLTAISTVAWGRERLKVNVVPYLHQGRLSVLIYVVSTGLQLRRRGRESLD
jgi:hypothetical protein